MLKTLENRGSLRALYETMALIRAVGVNLQKVSQEGKLSITAELDAGQEGVAAGVIAALDLDRDIICSNHSGLGTYLAWSGDAKGLIAELLGDVHSTGTSHQRKRTFYSKAVAGGIAPVSIGMALAEKSSKSGVVVVQFAGQDLQGSFYGHFNVAALWKLPYLLVVEDTDFGQCADRARAFGVPFVEVDGSDAEAVFEGAECLIEHIRSGEGPAILSCVVPNAKDALAVARTKLTWDFCDAVDAATASQVRSLVEAFASTSKRAA